MPRDLGCNRIVGDVADWGATPAGGYLGGKVPSAGVNAQAKSSVPAASTKAVKTACCGSCAEDKPCEGSKIMGMQPLLFIALVGGLVYMASR